MGGVTDCAIIGCDVEIHLLPPLLSCPDGLKMRRHQQPDSALGTVPELESAYHGGVLPARRLREGPPIAHLLPLWQAQRVSGRLTERCVHPVCVCVVFLFVCVGCGLIIFILNLLNHSLAPIPATWLAYCIPCSTVLSTVVNVWVHLRCCVAILPMT